MRVRKDIVDVWTYRAYAPNSSSRRCPGCATTRYDWGDGTFRCRCGLTWRVWVDSDLRDLGRWNVEVPPCD